MFWSEDLCLPIKKSLFPRCFVFLPYIRFLHRRYDDGFICFRISSFTACSPNPNCDLIASKGVRSSQAISIILDMSSLFIKDSEMTGRSFYIVHWAGFILTLFFITLSILDPSGDEYVIHFTTSMMPWILTSTLNSLISKRIIVFPWQKS